MTSLANQRAARFARLRATMAAKRANGAVSGRVPLGFIVNQGEAQEDPRMIRLLAEAKEMQERGCSLRTIRRVMYQRGLENRKGKLISVSGLWQILKTL